MMSISTTTLSDLAGLMGVVMYVLSYALLQSGRLRQESYTYPALNLLAASLVLISLSSDFNLASALIQISWILISLSGLQRLMSSRRKQRLAWNRAPSMLNTNA